MREVGILILLAVVIGSAYFLFRAKVDRKPVSAFAAIAALVGFGLILGDRITT